MEPSGRGNSGHAGLEGGRGEDPVHGAGRGRGSVLRGTPSQEMIFLARRGSLLSGTKKV